MSIDEGRNDDHVYRSIAQEWSAEGVPRWLLRQAYELGVPQQPSDAIKVAAWLLVAVIARIIVDLPPQWWFARCAAAEFVAVYATLLIGYAAHYAGKALG